MFFVVFFFFKQKTAYEMRISDWSSDVCSSDLPDLPVILLTAWTHLEAAVDLVKAGAADYLAKPWDDQKLMATVNNLLELGQAQRELSRQHAGERQRRTALLRENDLR